MLYCSAYRGDDVLDGRLPLSKQQHTLLQLCVGVIHRTQQTSRELADSTANGSLDEELLPSAKRRKVCFWSCLNPGLPADALNSQNYDVSSYEKVMFAAFKCGSSTCEGHLRKSCQVIDRLDE